MPKRVATLETLRKARPRQSRQTLHAPSLTRLPVPHPTHPRNPLPYPGHLPHNSPPPQSHSPPDRGIFSYPLPPQSHSPPDRGHLLPRSHSTSSPSEERSSAAKPSTCSLSSKYSSLPSTALSLSSFSRLSRALSRVFFPLCHSKALPTRLLQRVLCVHPSAPITPSPCPVCSPVQTPGLENSAGARPRNSSAFSHFLPRA